jgi:hypothetical protein
VSLGTVGNPATKYMLVRRCCRAGDPSSFVNVFLSEPQMHGY